MNTIFFRYAVVAVILLLLYYTTGLYIEDTSEAFMDISHNGLFLDGPVAIFNNCNVYFLATHAIVWFKKCFPALDAHGLFLVLITVVYLGNYWQLFSGLKTGFNAKGNRWDMLIVLILLAFFIGEIFFIQFTRASIQLLFSGVFLYNMDKSRSARIMGFFSVCLGLVLRFEAFFAVFPMLFLILLILEREYSKAAVFRLLKRNSFFFLFQVLVLIGTYSSYTREDKLYEPYRAIINTIADYQANDHTPEFKNRLDSLKYQMILYYNFEDVEHIGAKEIVQMGVVPLERDPLDALFKVDLRQRFSKLLYEFEKLPGQSKWMFLVTILLMLVMLVRTGRRYLGRYALLMLAVLLLLVLISLYIKMEDRVATPVFLAANVLMLLYMARDQDGFRPDKGREYFMVFFLLLLGNAAVHMPALLDRRATYAEAIRVRNYFDKEKPDVVFWDVMSQAFLCNRIGGIEAVYDKERYYSLNMPLYVFYPEYTAHMQAKFGTARYIDMVKQSIDNPKMVYVGIPEKMDMFVEYYRLQYGLNVKAVNVTGGTFYEDRFFQPPIRFNLYTLATAN